MDAKKIDPHTKVWITFSSQLMNPGEVALQHISD